MAFFFMAPFVCLYSLLIKLCIKVWHFRLLNWCWRFDFLLRKLVEIAAGWCESRVTIFLWEDFQFGTCHGSSHNAHHQSQKFWNSLPSLIVLQRIKERPYFLLGQVGIDPQNHFFAKGFERIQPHRWILKTQLRTTCANRYIQATVLAFAYFSYPQMGGNASSICEWTCYTPEN